MKTNKKPIVFAISMLILSVLACNMGQPAPGATEVSQGNEAQAASTEAPTGNESTAA